ncbi:MAG: acyltransferase family protein, partial [Phycisphaerales bacterium]
KKIQTGENDLAGRTLVEWVQNLTLTQWVTLLFHPSTYAAKNPTNFVTVYWSLGYEEQFYLVMGLFMVLAARLRWSVTAMTGVLMAVGLGVNIVWPEVACGLFIEYWALFAIGVLVFHRLCRMEIAGMRRAVDGLLVGILAWSAYMRWFAGIEWAADSPALSLLEKAEHRVVYGELMTASGFALVLIGMRPLSAWVGSKVWFRPLVGLGAITFSLYLIHQFNLTLMSKVAAMVLTMAGLTDFGAEGRWHIPYLVTQIAMHLGLATVFWFFCERPFLNKRV